MPSDGPHNISDHPYNGYSIDAIKDLVDGDIVKSQLRAFEKELKVEIDNMYASLEIGTPVKVTKGSKDKRGLEGFIIHAKEPLQGSGKALFVYDVLSHKNCMVRSTSTKARIPSPGERSLLKETYGECERLAHLFTQGKNVTLKSDPSMKGYLRSNADLNPNLEGHGFYQVHVSWHNGSNTTNILTELDLVS
jgi:hypothetical protein